MIQRGEFVLSVHEPLEFFSFFFHYITIFLINWAQEMLLAACICHAEACFNAAFFQLSTVFIFSADCDFSMSNSCKEIFNTRKKTSLVSICKFKQNKIIVCTTDNRRKHRQQHTNYEYKIKNTTMISVCKVNASFIFFYHL